MQIYKKRQTFFFQLYKREKESRKIYLARNFHMEVENQNIN